MFPVRWFQRRRYRPEWDRDRFADRVAARSVRFAEFRNDRDRSRRETEVSAYFRSRTEPRFFVDATETRSAAILLERQRPAWRERLLRRVREEAEHGIEIYAWRGPPLQAGFPWAGRKTGPGGDKLYGKRPHRFGFGPRIALAALYGEPATERFRSLLEEWMAVAASRDNALAYDSNLTVIERVLALSWTWAFLAAREPATPSDLELETTVLHVLGSDIDYLVPRLGDSFANNHLLADYFAGWFIGCVWPELAPVDGLRKRFEPLWVRELLRQTLSDGTSFEHSTHYHEYACEMAAAYLILCRRNGLPVLERVVERTSRMLEFQAVLAGRESSVVAIGDATEDPLFPLDSGDGWGAAAWREIHRALFPSALEESSADTPAVERAFWLLGGALPERAALATPAMPSLRAYPCGGFYVFDDPARHCRLIVRTGPSDGEEAAAGHAHSDLLSVALVASGRPIIVDAGTYTYRAGRFGVPAADWRSYFRGAAAHNGLSIDGRDALGEVAGAFRRKPLETFVSVEREHDAAAAKWVEAVVVGRGVYSAHRRGVVQIPGEYFVIYDGLPDMHRRSRAELGFQFAPHVTAEAGSSRAVQIRYGEQTLLLAGSKDLDAPICLTGSFEPLGGWVSPRYGEILPAPQARFAVRPGARLTAFLLCDAENPRPVEITIEAAGEHGLCIKITGSDVEDVLLLNRGALTTEFSWGGLTFLGRLLWIRCRNGSPSVLRWVGGARFDWPDKKVSVARPEPAASLEIDWP